MEKGDGGTRMDGDAVTGKRGGVGLMRGEGMTKGSRMRGHRVKDG